MSSSNLISVIYVPETVYGTPDSPLSGVTAETARYTSESLSGTPITTESQVVRTDRMSSGQVAVGLEVGGDISFELARDQFHDDWHEAAMMSTWVAAQDLSTDVTLTPDPADDQQADLVVTGDLSVIGVVPGVVLQLIPATGTPVVVSVISVTSTTEAVVATKRGEEAIVAEAMTVSHAAHCDIGAVQRSFTVGKSYLDVTHDVGTDIHSQTYGGELVSTLNVSATYGEIVTGSYSSLGNSYAQEAPSYEQQIVAAGGTVNPAGTSQSLNSSLDFPLVTVDGVSTDFCIESLTIDLDNGLDPSNCIGKEAPIAYTLGTAAVAITMNAYLSDTAYDSLMAEKMTQTPLSFMFTATNNFGGYAYALSAVQLNFPDPASGGQNTQTMIEAAGTGKVGENGESSLTIYRLVGDQ